MMDVRVFETAHHLHNRVDFADMGQEFYYPDLLLAPRL